MDLLLTVVEGHKIYSLLLSELSVQNRNIFFFINTLEIFTAERIFRNFLLLIPKQCFPDWNYLGRSQGNGVH